MNKDQLLYSKIEGNGEPLLILHGFLGMSDNWNTLGGRFAERFEVHLIDQRNHGRSFHSPDMSYELMAVDLLSYIDHFKLKNVNLLGHSMGGKVAMLFAVTNPEKVKSLIVADIAPRFYPRHHDFILNALQAVNFSEVASRSEIEEIFESYIADWGIRQFLLKNVYWKSKNQLAYRFNLQALVDNIDEIGVALPARTVFNGHTLFLKGENSGYIADEDIDMIKMHFPNAQIETVKNAGHWLHAENPDDFYHKVVRFIG